MTKKYVGELKFSSPISIERSMLPNLERVADDVESVMDIDIDDDGLGYIEWNVDALDMGESIGLWFNGNSLTDYDGVFELPKQLVDHLTEQGYDMSYVEEV